MDKIKANMTKNRKGAGRPKIIVDIEILKNLASIGCPDYEIASVLWLDCVPLIFLSLLRLPIVPIFLL